MASKRKSRPLHPGLEEYEYQIFMVHDGTGGGGVVYTDPADAISAAEENAECEGADWYVSSYRSVDELGVPIDKFIHTAKAGDGDHKPKKKAKR